MLVFSPFFRCSLRLDARIPESGTRRPGAGSATVQNGCQKSGSPPTYSWWIGMTGRGPTRRSRPTAATRTTTSRCASRARSFLERGATTRYFRPIPSPSRLAVHDCRLANPLTSERRAGKFLRGVHGQRLRHRRDRRGHPAQHRRRRVPMVKVVLAVPVGPYAGAKEIDLRTFFPSPSNAAPKRNTRRCAARARVSPPRPGWV